MRRTGAQRSVFAAARRRHRKRVCWLLMSRLLAINDIRSKLQRGEPSVGCWLQLPSSDVAEIVGAAGFDWVAVDAEHGAIDPAQYPDIFRAIELGGALPLVRVPAAEEVACRRALDAGAGGVIVPRIESADQLRALRGAVRWPPDGHRGVGFSRANHYGVGFDDYREEAQAPLFVAMIESAAGLANVGEIAAVEGVDSIFIGPYDLSASLGATGDITGPLLQSAMAEITSAAEAAGVPIGIHSVSPSREDLQATIDLGFLFVAYSTDALVLATALREARITEPDRLAE